MIRPEDIIPGQIEQLRQSAPGEVHVKLVKLAMDIPKADGVETDLTTTQNLGEVLAPDSVAGIVAKAISRNLIDQLSGHPFFTEEMRGVIAATASLTALAIDQATLYVEEPYLPPQE